MWFAEDTLYIIKPSQELKYYSLLSPGLPSVFTFYIRGYFPEPEFEYGNTPDITYGDDIFENSFKGKTIAPTNPPSPFNSLIFLDTLKSYTTQSLSLGWIANQTTGNKYLTFFDTAKVQIQQNRNWSARFTLDTVIAHVKRDSSGLLSSEAYALIKFNTEYLIDNMPGTIAIASPINIGWNMVSVPNYIQNFSDSAIYPNMQSPIYTYETIYIKRTTLKNGEGYWIKMNSNQIVNYKGMKIDSLRVPVKNGWNMIGSVSSALHHSKVRADSTTSLTSKFYGYSTQGYTIDTILQPGKGYWIKVNGNGNLILNSNYSVSGAYPNFNEHPTAQAPGIPNKPVLQLPANGSTNISITPTLSWIEVHSAGTYHLQVSTNFNFTCLLINDANITTETKQIGPLYGGITYYWRVSATNTNGTSDWSNVRNFKTRGKTLFEPCPEVEELSALDQFSVADAEGKRQNLYVRNGGRLISKKLSYAEELPPEQLEGIFNVRNQSGKYIESIPPDKVKRKISVKVKNAKYPLKINWDIIAGNGVEYWLLKPTGNPLKLTGKGSIELDERIKGNIQIEAQAVLPGPCENNLR
ncbi:MAG: fibronectin type III domain-containing protein [Bacteroidota bacterium]|nr:fibronectin type III domain-containing protein [Bacteroidota bacterium]